VPTWASRPAGKPIRTGGRTTNVAMILDATHSRWLPRSPFANARRRH